MYLKMMVPFWIFMAMTPVATARECATPEIFTQMPQKTVVLDDGARHHEMKVRIADYGIARRAGYQNVCPEDARDSGILFVFPYAVSTQFHMNNVYLELDIVFFDDDGAFINHAVMAPPASGQKSALYASERKARYALELPAGSWDELGLSEGVRLETLGQSND